MDEFHKGSKRSNRYCKPCMSSYFKEYYSKRKEHYLKITNINRRKRQNVLKGWLRELKSAPCFDCNVIYPHYVMDFDHRDMLQKVDTIPKLIASNASKARILEEITKCDLVCACCHRLRGYNRYIAIGATPTHLSPAKKLGKFLKEQAKDRPCVDCDGVFNTWQMDLDHLPGSNKVMRIGNLSHKGTPGDVKAEILKCEAVCANCHRKRTFNRIAFQS